MEDTGCGEPKVCDSHGWGIFRRAPKALGSLESPKGFLWTGEDIHHDTIGSIVNDQPGSAVFLKSNTLNEAGLILPRCRMLTAEKVSHPVSNISTSKLLLRRRRNY